MDSFRSASAFGEFSKRRQFLFSRNCVKKRRQFLFSGGPMQNRLDTWHARVNPGPGIKPPRDGPRTGWSRWTRTDRARPALNSHRRRTRIAGGALPCNVTAVGGTGLGSLSLSQSLSFSLSLCRIRTGPPATCTLELHRRSPVSWTVQTIPRTAIAATRITRTRRGRTLGLHRRSPVTKAMRV
jgi:hypothetical protein